MGIEIAMSQNLCAGATSKLYVVQSQRMARSVCRAQTYNVNLVSFNWATAVGVTMVRKAALIPSSTWRVEKHPEFLVYRNLTYPSMTDSSKRKKTK